MSLHNTTSKNPLIRECVLKLVTYRLLYTSVRGNINTVVIYTVKDLDLFLCTISLISAIIYDILSQGLL